MKQILKTATWIFMGLAVIFFWLSLRSTEGNMEYTLYALAMIVVAWIANYFLKKHENGEEE